MRELELLLGLLLAAVLLADWRDAWEHPIPYFWRWVPRCSLFFPEHRRLLCHRNLRMLARSAPESTPAKIRIPAYAVWDTVVFVMNILAVFFIGLQIRPILASPKTTDFMVAGAVLMTVIVVRIAWHMSFNAVMRWRHREHGFHPPRPMMRPSIGSGLIISWSGMRGIVSLAAAMALPATFPYRDLIVLTAFAVVLGTLVLQGLTLKPLLRAVNLDDDDPIGREVGRVVNVLYRLGWPRSLTTNPRWRRRSGRRSSAGWQ
jgi:hypothetical protein